MRRALLPPLTPQELWVLCHQKGLPPWCGAVAGVLHRLRLQRGWSQEQLAGASKVSRQMIGQIELLRHLPCSDKHFRLVRALGWRMSAFDKLVERWIHANSWPV